MTSYVLDSMNSGELRLLKPFSSALTFVYARDFVLFVLLQLHSRSILSVKHLTTRSYVLFYSPLFSAS